MKSRNKTYYHWSRINAIITSNNGNALHITLQKKYIANHEGKFPMFRNEYNYYCYLYIFYDLKPTSYLSVWLSHLNLYLRHLIFH